jgi:hypothetical protein
MVPLFLQKMDLQNNITDGASMATTSDSTSELARATPTVPAQRRFLWKPSADVKQVDISALVDEEEEEEETVRLEDKNANDASPSVKPAATGSFKPAAAGSFKPDTRRFGDITAPVSDIETTFKLKGFKVPGPADYPIVYTGESTSLQLVFHEVQVPTKVNNQSLSHLCLICAELGLDKKVYSGVPSNQKSHLKQHANSEFRFHRLKQLQGKILRIADGRAPTQANTLLRFTVKPPVDDAVSAYHSSLVKYVISAGLPISTVTSSPFRELMRAANNVPQGVPLKLGRSAFCTKVLARFDDYWRSFYQSVASDDCCSWSVVFDGWDWGKKHKILGATAIVLSQCENGLTLGKFPLIFRLLRGNPAYNDDDEEYMPMATISSADDMSTVILGTLQERAALNQVRVPFDKFVGGKGDGASNAVNCSEALNENADALSAITAAVPQDRGIVQAEVRCLAHALGLAIKDAIGYPKRKPESEVPPGPGDDVLDFFKKVRSAVKSISDAKCWLYLQERARTLGRKPPHAVHLDMEVRWLSFYHMIDEFVGNIPVYQSLQSYMPSLELPCFEPIEITAMRELVAVMKPLMEATIFLETSAYPTTPYVLPMIACILQTYIVKDPTGLFAVPTATSGSLAANAMSQVFEVSTKDGMDDRAVSSMTPIARDFTVVLAKHLQYRLCTIRKNLNAIDLLAAWTDPFGRGTIHYWCQRPDIEELCKRIVATYAEGTSQVSQLPQGAVASSSTSTGSSSRCVTVNLKRQRLTPTLNRFSDKCEAFEDQAAESIACALHLGDGQDFIFNIGCIIKASKVINALAFWTPDRRKRFPATFKAAAICAGSASHSCLQESVFSSANDTLSTRRRRLTQTPELLEALVVLRYALNCSRFEHEREEEEEEE